MSDGARGSAAARAGAVLVSLLVSAVPAGSRAQPEEGGAEARRLVEAGLAALGGLDGVPALTLVAEGIYSPSVGGQGRRPGERLELPMTETVVFDLEGDRIVSDLEARRNDHSLRHRRTLLMGVGGGRIADFGGGDFVVVLEPAAARATRAAERRKLPHLLLLEALEHAATLRTAGASSTGGRAQDLVTFTDASGADLTLVLDRETRLPAACRWRTDSPVHGPTTAEVAFPDYRPVPGGPGLQVPTGRVARIAGEVTEELRYVRVEPEAPSEVSFELPAGLEIVPPDWRGQEFAIQWLDAGVGLVANAARLNVLFVELEDGILIVDAPRNPTVSRRILDAVRAELPGKPLRYAVLTHHHADHTGGLAAYVEAGATVVTTPGNRELVAALAGTAEPPRVELVEGRRVLGRGERTVELIDIGPTPHVDEALVVYLPRQKILFQADHFIRYSFQEVAGPGGVAVNYGPTKRFFAEKILASGLAVEKILGSHNDAILTPRDLEVFLDSVEGAGGEGVERP